MKQCPNCNQFCDASANFCPNDATDLRVITTRIQYSTAILLGLSEIEHLVRLHQDSVYYRIWKVGSDSIKSMNKRNYNPTLVSDRIWEEIEKSRELLRGFAGKKSGKDICVFLEKKFTRKKFDPIFVELQLKLAVVKNKEETLQKLLKVAIDRVFTKLIKGFHQLERG